MKISCYGCRKIQRSLNAVNHKYGKVWITPAKVDIAPKELKDALNETRVAFQKVIYYCMIVEDIIIKQLRVRMSWRKLLFTKKSFITEEEDKKVRDATEKIHRLIYNCHSKLGSIGEEMLDEYIELDCLDMLTDVASDISDVVDEYQEINEMLKRHAANKTFRDYLMLTVDYIWYKTKYSQHVIK